MNSPRFREALLFAAELHAEQTRKGSVRPRTSRTCWRWRELSWSTAAMKTK